MSYHSDDNGNRSWMRIVLTILVVAFLVWNTLMICVHLFVAKLPVTELFADGYLSWSGQMLGYLLGGKVGQKGVEVVKDIITSKNNGK